MIGIGSDARIILNDDERKKWSKTFNAANYDRVFGPRTRFEPGGESSAINALMNNALYGGLVNTQEDAVAYAHALMRTTPRFSQIPVSALHAAEKSHIWHVTTTRPGHTRTDRDLELFA